MAILLFAVFLGLLLLSVPIALSLGLASLVVLVASGFPPTVIAQKMFTGLDSFPFLAVPFFILAGSLMETGGISARLVRLAMVLVGHVRGGLGMVVVVATIFFSDISGSSVADTAAIGSIMIPAMLSRNYPAPLATSIVASAGAAGILIPPCITMIIYALVANVSIGYLFAAGFVPGALMAVSLLALIYVQARRYSLPAEKKATFAEIMEALWAALPTMLMPVIILGGILSGVFTATESAVVAVAYGAFLSLVVYRELDIKDVPAILVSTARLTGIVMFLVGMSTTFAWVLTTQQVPQMLTAWMLSVSSSPWVFLLMVNVLLLIVGTFMDATAAVVVLMPLLYPIAQQLHIDLIHFGIVITANLGLGLIHPPLGIALFIASGIAKVSVEDVIKPMLPFLAVLFAALLVITYVPGITLLVPRLLGYTH
jgi:C4-dicarboxylate transporter, DctM subunit